MKKIKHFFLLVFSLALFQPNVYTKNFYYDTGPENAAMLDVEVVTLVDVSCFGLTDGAVTVNATGGTLPYTYVWSNGMIGPVLIGLQAGTYTVTATDLLGATGELTVTIDEPLELDLDIANQVNIDCGNPTGSATVTTNGGTGVVTYLWSNGATTATVTDLSAGIYVVTATDENLCTDIQTVEITADVTLPAVAVVASAEINCLEPEVILDGTGSATGAGITHLWTTADGHIVSGENTLNPTVDEPGTYVLEVTDLANSCTATDSVLVTSNITLPTVNINSGGGVDLQIDCLTPEITLDGTGSATGADILYLWTTADGHIVSGENTLNPLVDAAGTYNLSVTNAANGCSNEDDVEVTADVEIPIVNIETGAGVDLQLDCLTPELTLSGQGSATGPDIEYLWTTADGHIVSGENTLNPLVDAAGTYTLTVTDLLNGCSADASVLVTADLDVPDVSIETPVDLDCDNSIITLDATASSSGSGFDYQWTTVDGHIVSGANTLLAQVNAAGTYSLNITGANGCQADASVVVNGTTPLDISVSGDLNLLCFGDANGSIDVTVSGDGPFVYLWADGSTTANLTGLSAGIYPLTVTDINGCNGTIEVQITQPDSLFAEVDVTAVSSTGAADGSVALNVSGGTPPYTYLWSNGSTTASIDGLAAGMVSYTITDANGCSLEGDVDVPDADDCNLDVSVSGTDADCDQANGTASASVTGANGTVTYAWSNGMTGADISGLTGGDYTVTVTDAENCTATTSITIGVVDDEAPEAIAQDITISLDADGNATINADMINNGSNDACGDVTISIDITDFTCDDIGDNTVTLTVTDGNGNTATATATVTIVDDMAPVAECPDDIIVNNPTGGITYDMPVIVDNCSNTTISSIILLEGMASGAVFPVGTTTVRYAIVTSTGDMLTCSFDVTVTGGLVIDIDVTPPSCPGLSDGSATVNVTGGSGNYTYLWLHNGATTPTADGLGAGDYAVLVTDDQGMTGMATVNITDPTPLDITIFAVSDQCDDDLGSISVIVTGGTPPYTYLWYDADGNVVGTSRDLIDVPAGNYSVEVTDANGCTFTSATITVDFLTNTVEFTNDDIEFSLLPNPTYTGRINIDLKMDIQREIRIELLDINGQWKATLVPAQILQNLQQQVDITAMASGVYLVRVFADGIPAVTKKVIYIK